MNFLALILLSVFRMVVIPVQFSDTKFTASEEQLLNTVQSAESYFRAQPSGILPGKPVTGQVEFTLAPVVTVSGKLSYYGANYSDRKDVLLHEAVREAVKMSTGAVDFSLFDNNSDGYVDNVHIITAGHSESEGGSPDNIWPQHDNLGKRGGTISAGKKTVNSYTVSTEYNSTGIMCHEIGHFLGLPDLYDTDEEGSGGLSPGLRGTSLMDNGCFNNDGKTPPNISALDLDIMGRKPTIAARKSYTLQPVSRGGEFLKIESGDENEYYLLECRVADNWDRFIGGSGLVAYHIDRSSADAGWSDLLNRTLTAGERWSYGQVNSNPAHECAKPLTGPSDDGSAKAIFFPGNGYSGIGQIDGPTFTFRDKSTSPLAVKDIQSNIDNSISFEIIEPITIEGSIVHQDGITLKWDTDLPEDEILSYAINWTDGRITGAAEAPPDSRSFTIERLSPMHAYRAWVTIILKTGTKYRNGISFTTKFYQENTYPYIYLGNIPGRAKDGSFLRGTGICLKVYNAPDMIRCQWYYDSEPITVDADGTFILSRSGTLRAVLTHKNGSREVIEKEITVR